MQSLKQPSGNETTNQLRDIRKKLDEINLDKLRISENMSQSMSCIPDASTMQQDQETIDNHSNINRSNNYNNKKSVHDEEEEMQLAETLKLLQGKVPKLNVDVTNHLYNSNNNTGSVR